MKTTTFRKLAVGAAPLLVAAGMGVTVLAGSASAANGTLTLSPATGGALSTSSITFATSAACPSNATNAIVTASGANFGTTPQNITGNTDISSQTGSSTSVAMNNSWADALTNAGGSGTLLGDVTVTLNCIDLFNTQTFASYQSVVTFTAGTGANSSYALQAPATPAPTPTPTPTPTPVPTPTPTPAPNSDNITVVVPDTTNNPGLFTVSTGSGALDMGSPVTGSANGTPFLDYGCGVAGSSVNATCPTTGPQTAPRSLPPITVTDQRPGLLAWSVVGQLSNFDQGLVFGRYMGWHPTIATAGMGAVAGPVVASGYPGTTSGLHAGRLLANAPDGHGGNNATTAALSADLNLHVPTSVPAGTYTAVLTVTALS